MASKYVKCRNEACPLNKNKKCINPCRDRKDFSCANEDVEKEKIITKDLKRNYFIKWSE